jgi:hypothetical protein
MIEQHTRDPETDQLSSQLQLFTLLSEVRDKYPTMWKSQKCKGNKVL